LERRRRTLVPLTLPKSSAQRTIIIEMARGWESKSVEAQQAEADEKSSKPRPRLSAEAASLVRERESLTLSRSRVLQQIEVSQNPRHQELLRQALVDLDRKLSQLDPGQDVPTS
jgi:hypothetical protein